MVEKKNKVSKRKNKKTPLFILSLLERKPLTTKNIQAKLEIEFELEYEEKSINRIIVDLIGRGFLLERKKKYHFIVENDLNYYNLVVKLFAEISQEDADMNNIIYGNINYIEVAKKMQMNSYMKHPAEFLSKLYFAIMKSQRIEFMYWAQSEELFGTWSTIRNYISDKMKIKRKPDKKSFIPKYLVFSNDHFLLLGESLYKDEKAIRQYCISGITDLEIKEQTQITMDIDPKKLYKHSIQTWLGGEIYNLIIEEISLSHEQPKKNRKEILVNGEKEIIMEVMKSLGSKKIVNPPDSLVEFAKQRNLSIEYLFIFE